MNTIPYSKFKHGQRVTCEIEGKTIKDAKISIEVLNGSIYVCQNIKKGQRADDFLGYQHSWKIVYENEDFYDGKEQVENLQFLPRTLDDLEEGDVLICKDGQKKTVLGICGKVYMLSVDYDQDYVDAGFTLQEIKSRGYTLKQEESEEEITELTLEDVAKLANVPVEKLRIKD